MMGVRGWKVTAWLETARAQTHAHTHTFTSDGE